MLVIFMAKYRAAPAAANDRALPISVISGEVRADALRVPVMRITGASFIWCAL